MAQYLTTTEFQGRSIVPPQLITWINGQDSSWLDTQLASFSGYLDARLRKRYSVPFADPSEIVKVWVTDVVSLRLYLRRGVDSTDAQFAQVQRNSDRAFVEIKEAADAVDGLFDLPLLSAGGATAVDKGGPFVYSETSPYVGLDVQRETARAEDSNGVGT